MKKIFSFFVILLSLGIIFFVAKKTINKAEAEPQKKQQQYVGKSKNTKRRAIAVKKRKNKQTQKKRNNNKKNNTANKNLYKNWQKETERNKERETNIFAKKEEVGQPETKETETGISVKEEDWQSVADVKTTEKSTKEDRKQSISADSSIVYGKMNVNAGYNFGNINIKEVNTFLSNEQQAQLNTKLTKQNHSLALGAGYNLYFKLSDHFHPFIGLEATAQVPIKTSMLKTNGGVIDNSEESAGSSDASVPEGSVSFDELLPTILDSHYFNSPAVHATIEPVVRGQYIALSIMTYDTNGELISEQSTGATYFSTKYYDEPGRIRVVDKISERNVEGTSNVITTWQIQDESSGTSIYMSRLKVPGEASSFYQSDENGNEFIPTAPDEHGTGSNNYELNMRFHEYFFLNAKFGGRIIFNRNLSLQPYLTAGFNVVQAKFNVISNEYNVSGKKINIGLTAGCGLEALIRDRFSIALEYRRTFNKFNLPSPVGEFKMQSNNLNIKVRYYFL